MRWIGRVENALFNTFGGSSHFDVLHPQKIFLPNGVFGRLHPL